MAMAMAMAMATAMAMAMAMAMAKQTFMSPMKTVISHITLLTR